MPSSPSNPLLRAWDGPFGLPPFADADDPAFAEAIESELAAARASVDRIIANPDPPSFSNTIAVLERSGLKLDRLLSAFSLLAATASTSARRALQREIAPEIARYRSGVSSDRRLFARIEALWSNRHDLALTAEELRVLELTRRRHLRGGAALDPARAGAFREIAVKLAFLGTEFRQNLLADEAASMLPLGPSDLDGLPPALVAALGEAGRERGVGGPALIATRALLVPFLQYSPRRDLRRVAHAAWRARGTQTADNHAIAAETLRLRAALADTLGYSDYTALRLEEQMAGDADQVRALLDAVWAPAIRRASAEAEVLTAALHADGESGPLRPWDWRYYVQRGRQATGGPTSAEIAPYLSLPSMIAAAFDCARRLFGIEAVAVDVPLHHPDARAWEMRRDGRHLGLFVGDYFARAGKRSGAWCTTLGGQHRLAGDARPIVVNVCNFSRPPDGGDACLAFDEARTLFHEFGHALHHLLSDVTFPSVAGTSVARDFVEVPSRLFERWLSLPSVLDRHARHVATDAPLPEVWRERLLAAGREDAGFSTIEYLASAYLDLRLHAAPAPADLAAAEARILAEIGLPDAIAPRHGVSHFAHIFGGDGYASAYYSYLWSERLEADAFQLFEGQGGPFAPDVAARLEEELLSAGGTAEPAELYLRFRGHMPDERALLRARGLGAGVPAADGA